MEKLVERSLYIQQIKGFIGKDIIKVITGIRRSGKSELLRLLIGQVLETTDNEHIVYINFEDLQFDNIKTYNDLYAFVLEKIKDDEKYYFFFDEIQEVHEWERAINSLRLKNTDIYITGSNSKLLAGELSTLLGGRFVSFEIMPLTLAEFLQFRKENSLSDNSSNLDGFIKLGGFPFLSTQDFSPKEASLVIRDIHSSIILRDVIARNNIKNVRLLEKILAFFYDHIGSLISLRKIAEYISGGEKKKTLINLETISNYVSYLETAFIIKRVPRYDIKGKKIFETNDKFYLADHSLCLALKQSDKISLSGVVENIVFSELVSRGYKVFVGKLDTKEVDFVAEKNGEKIYIQVCLEFTTKETYFREFAPLKEIKDNYPKFVVSLDKYANRNDEGIIGISLEEFLLAP